MTGTGPAGAGIPAVPGPGGAAPSAVPAPGGAAPSAGAGPGGSALERGLAVALGAFDRAEPADLPARSRGVIALLEENCTVCMLCARECPDWCVYIDSHTETVEVPGGRPRQRNVLDRFAIDFALCMYCGICVEVCPFDALFWAPEFEYAARDVTELTHERDRLREWLRSVPPPPVLDPTGPVPKEVRQAGS